MVFLEFIAEKLLGPEQRCPHCNSDSFTIKAPDRAGKVRWKCYACDSWGDEYDLLKEVYPSKDYPWRRVRVALLQKQFKRETPADAVCLPRGMGRDTTERPRYWNDVSNVWADFREEIADDTAVQILVALRDRCQQRRVKMADVIDYWEGFGDWQVKSDLRHLRGCDDEDCEARVCRAGRGLEPLTPEEVEAGKLEQEEAERKHKERIRKRVRRSIAKAKKRRQKQ